MNKSFVFTGSRYFQDEEMVAQVLDEIPDGSLVAQGGAAGLDAVVRKLCEDRDAFLVTFHAPWNVRGGGAGPIRNQVMLAQVKPDVVHAFPHKGSRGTWDCVNKARALGITVVVHES